MLIGTVIVQDENTFKKPRYKHSLDGSGKAMYSALVVHNAIVHCFFDSDNVGSPAYSKM